MCQQHCCCGVVSDVGLLVIAACVAQHLGRLADDGTATITAAGAPAGEISRNQCVVA